MEKEKIQILWFKKNLRTEDNEILANINPDIPVLWVYFFEKSILEAPDFGEMHLRFICESLSVLKKNLKIYNISLITLPYEALEWFIYLRNIFDITHIFSHEETGNWLSFQRDIAVQKYCKEKNIPLQEFPTNGIVRRLKSRDMWSRIWHTRMHADLFLPQSSKIIFEQGELEILSQQTFRSYAPRREKHQRFQVWGEDMGKKILQDFLTKRSKNYSYHISKPFESQDSCSRLSPYITYGCLSVKSIYQETQKRIQELRSLPWESGKWYIKQLDFFLARLHWQSHFIQKLEDEPSIEWQNLNPAFDSIRTEADDILIEKVFHAESGVPYIDATIRQLQSTGWCNFRSRAILTSFLCNTCMQPWQAIGGRLAKLFLDYEPGIHYSQLQMQAGTSGINTIRIYNPILNGREKDSEWKFIKTYLPELENVPTKYLHEPWIWEHFESIDYPKAIIDIEVANREARKILWETKGALPKELKEKIYKKHGSRVFRGPKKTTKKTSITPQISLF
jgi:deoxyribodipyrimidine photo-lyase